MKQILVGSVLASLLVLSGAFILRARPQAKTENGPEITSGIGIQLPAGGPWPVAVGADHAVFYVPAVGKGEMLGVLVAPVGRFLGVRVIPSVEGNSVKIAVSALLGDKRKLSEATCDEIRSWPSVNAGSYEGKQGASFPLTGLGKLGLPVFQVDVLGGPMIPPSGGKPVAYCSCLSTRDELNPAIDTGNYPGAGKCVDVGRCGRCCRISPP